MIQVTFHTPATASMRPILSTRATWLSSLLVTLVLAGALGAQPTARRDFRVTLLGTGAPPLSLVRFGPSILVEVGDRTLVFDAGRGTAQRLAQLNVPLSRIDAVFFTHLHSDHVVGFPDLWLTGWILARRATPWEIFGPPGTVAMAEGLERAFALDLRIRVEEGGQNPAGGRLVAHDVGPGVVYERDGVRVIAFAVDHLPNAPAYGYRIESGGRTVVLSGDTRFSPGLIDVARGADLLVHEVAIAADTSAAAPYARAYAHHTPPERAAEVFTRARPRLAVYSHIVALGGSNEAEILQRTRRSYHGPVLLGEDLLSVRVGDTTATPRP